MNNCLIIFAKEPKKGRVKTRLRGYLSETQCVALYKALLKDTFELVKPLEHIAKVLAYDSSTDEPGYLKELGKGFIFYRQEGKDLGRRLHNAIKFSGKMHSDKTVIIGSDSPNLPITYVKEAFRRLEKNDIVLGPSADGGFYLLGIKDPCFEIFKDIQWGSGSVLEDTVKNAGMLDKKIAILKKWYDIDDAAGLIRLRKDLKKEKKAAPWTRKFLKI